MLAAACAQAAAWRDAGTRVPRIACNLSARTVMAAGFADTLRDVLARTGCSAERLTIELCESALIEIEDDVTQVLRSIADLGVRIAVASFGVGSSSLRRLKRFPITMLKLDKVFACDASSPRSQRVLLGAIVASAHDAGLSVIAGGVETHAQLEYLRAEGCDAVQGALAGRPLPPTEAIAFVGTFDSARLAAILH